MGISGSAINALGQTYELRVIAATVIGGANLMGGAGTAFGAVIGAALLEVIRNALLMAGIDSNWQGAFVGGFIILAVLIGLERNGKNVVAALKDSRVRKDGVARNAAGVFRRQTQTKREEDNEKTYITCSRGGRAYGLCGSGNGAGYLRAGPEEHEQPVLRSGARRLQEGRGGVERRVRVRVHRTGRARRR